MRPLLLALALSIPALAEDPKATPIEDGSTTTLPFGLKFDVPENWKVTLAKPGVYVLVPDGSNPSGILEELYMFASEEMDAELDSEKVKEALDKVRDELLPGGQLDGEATKGTFGEFEGLIYCYEGKAQDGKKVRLWLHVFKRGGHVCAVVALGYSKQLKARKDDVVAILGSIRKGKKRKGTDAAVREEMCGKWIYITNFTANNGGGRFSNTTVTLNADGTYVYYYESENTNPFGAVGTKQQDTGKWKATETSITFTSDDGGTATYPLEKRNHPKNVGDPMLVIDGKAFVTATPKPAWK